MGRKQFGTLLALGFRKCLQFGHEIKILANALFAHYASLDRQIHVAPAVSSTI